MKKKRQEYKEGAIVKIQLSNNKLAFGRLFQDRRIGVYDLIINEGDKLPTFQILCKHKIIFYAIIYKHVITKGEFEIIDHQPLTQVDIEMVPPNFAQDIIDINDCIIFYPNDRIPERKATPVECIGLERSTICEGSVVIGRLESFLNKQKNYYQEMSKVILSTNDIRYNPGPFLRWDFDKQEFFRVTEAQLKKEFSAAIDK